MTLVERLLHSLRRSGLDPDEVRVAVRAEGDVVERDHPIRRAVDLRALNGLSMTWEGGMDSLGQRVARAVQIAPKSPWLIVSGETIVDARVLPQLADLEGHVFFASGKGDERGAVLKLGVEAATSEL